MFKRTLTVSQIFLISSLMVIFRETDAQTTYIPTNDEIVIEAEMATAYAGNWELVEGRNARTYELKGWGMLTDSLISVKYAGEIVPEAMKGEVMVGRDSFQLIVGKPGPQAVVFTTLSKDTSMATMFGYDKGSELLQGKAPERRLAMFQGQSSLTSHGWRLFANAVIWASGKNKKGLQVVYVRHPSEIDRYDDITVAKLEILGYEVDMIEDDSINANLAESADLVILSASTRPEVIMKEVLNAKVPMIISNPEFYEHMYLTSASEFWEGNDQQIGYAMMNRCSEGNAFLRYAFYVETPGKYILHVLGKSSGYKVIQKMSLLIDPVLPLSNEDATHVELSESLNWYTSDSSIDLDRAGWHDLFLMPGDQKIESHRYPNWRVDKLMITKEGAEVSEEEADITVNEGVVSIPTSMIWAHNNPVNESDMWKVKENGTLIEGEAFLDQNDWMIQKKGNSYTGSGYIVYRGVNRERSVEGNNDSTTFAVRLGPLNSRLWIPVWVESEGNYGINLRAKHNSTSEGAFFVGVAGKNKDGSIQGWIPKEVRTLSTYEASSFTWSPEEFEGFALEKGLNYIFISACSNGLAIDRIAIYPDKEELSESILDPDTPTDSPVALKQ